jgi:hypothetical protein
MSGKNGASSLLIAAILSCNQKSDVSIAHGNDELAAHRQPNLFEVKELPISMSGAVLSDCHLHHAGRCCSSGRVGNS